MATPSNAVQANPYGAPRATVDDSREEFQPVRIFAVSGRIGRARYIAYTVALPLIVMFIAGLLGGFLGPVGVVAIAVGWIAVLAISIMLTVQRCHDFDTTGWLALLGLIPLVNLIFWFIPGSDSRNRFGAPTPPNSTGVLIAVWILPALFLVGIIAAISIPAYQQYVERAAQKQAK
jgi:uncharacterized membrane protein YhaH (DUF805 family)